MRKTQQTLPSQSRVCRLTVPVRARVRQVHHLKAMSRKAALLANHNRKRMRGTPHFCYPKSVYIDPVLPLYEDTGIEPPKKPMSRRRRLQQEQAEAAAAAAAEAEAAVEQQQQAEKPPAAPRRGRKGGMRGSGGSRGLLGGVIEEGGGEEEDALTAALRGR